MLSFEGISATWITADWEYKQVVLDFDVVAGSHTGKALASSLFSVLQDLGIEKKLLALTTDNAGTLCTMVKELSEIFSAEVIINSCLKHLGRKLVKLVQRIEWISLILGTKF